MRNQEETSPITDQLSEFLLILLNPALIMVMVGSLVFFLLHINYQGAFPGRVHYIFTLFVFATVLIARIAIEGGSEKAVPFGLALAVAVSLVLLRFQLSGLATIVFVAVVWWCAHRLTWDCTVLEHQPEGPGEGLMKSLGMEADQLVEQSAVNTAPQPETTDERARSPWWSWVVPSEHAHAPGASVVWFALAAIPIFGLGSVIAPTAVAHRQYSFQLFCVYLASALGLMMSTSLMGLRRYLRKRQLEIAPEMVATWLISGTVLVALLLVVSALLPRPGAEYTISQIPDLPTWQGEPPSTSELAVGNEGMNDPQRADREGTGPESASDAQAESTDDRRRQGEAPGQATESGRGPRRPGEGSDSGGDSESDSGTPSQGQHGRPATSSESSQSPSESNTNSTPSPDETDTQRRPPHRDSSPEASDSSSDQQHPPPSRPQRPPKPTRPPPMPRLSWGSFAALAELLRGLAYLVLALFVAYVTWRHRRLIIAALRDLYSAIKDFWNGLRGKDGGESAGVEDHVAPEPVRRFADCPDPFQSAGAHPAAVVQSTLEGLEVWASEHGSPRNDDQTLEEFTRDLLRALSRVPETIQGELSVLVRLHDQIAYAGRRVTMEQVQPLRRLWATLRRYQAKQ